MNSLVLPFVFAAVLAVISFIGVPPYPLHIIIVIMIWSFFKLALNDVIIIRHFMLLLGKGHMLMASGTRCRIVRCGIAKGPTAKIGKAGKAFAFDQPL